MLWLQTVLIRFDPVKSLYLSNWCTIRLL